MSNVKRMTLCAFVFGLSFSIEALAGFGCHPDCIRICLSEQIEQNLDQCHVLCGCDMGR